MPSELTRRFPPARQDAATTAAEERELVLPSFTSETAFTLGLALRAHIIAKFGPSPVVISITAGTTDQPFFFATCGPGSIEDNHFWVKRKRQSVARWGISTASMRNKYKDGMPLKYGTDEANVRVALLRRPYLREALDAGLHAGRARGAG